MIERASLTAAVEAYQARQQRAEHPDGAERAPLASR